MPTNHIGNTQNGNALKGLASAGHTLTGRLTPHLPIYEIRYFTLANSPLSGGKWKSHYNHRFDQTG
jgi:hypothetical protein